jgi:hypothetical protein
LIRAGHFPDTNHPLYPDHRVTKEDRDMRLGKRLGTLAAVAALTAVGIAALPGHAQAYWAWRGGYRVWIPAPVIVAPPPVYYAPHPYYAAPPVVYAAPPPVYYAPRRVWVPAHWRGGYWVPGHWA